MAKEPLKVNQIKAVLQRSERGQSVRTIAKTLGISRSRVHDNIKRAKAAGFTSHNLPDDADSVYELLFASTQSASRVLPDFGKIATELRKPDVTLTLLHEEYLQVNPTGLRYSQFCDRFRSHCKTLDLSMRQPHKAGDKLFLDFAGSTVPVIEIGEAHIFVAVLGASNYTFACATPDETSRSRVTGTTGALQFFGGVPAALVPDCPKTTVTKPCRYEPEINQSFQEMADHYRTTVLPARVRKPKDKAKAESGVLLVQRWILARLRHRTFMTLSELNDAISELLVGLNAKAFKKLPGSRKELFESLDQPALQKLPLKSYEYSERRSARVGNDYHVQVHVGERRYHLYSVPHPLVHRKLDLRLTARCVEIFDRGTLVATHVRDNTPGTTTLEEHMPEPHRAYHQLSAKALRERSSKVGPSCRKMIDRILSSRPHIEQGFRACEGVIRLKKRYGFDRLEAACARALLGDLISYRSAERILKASLDKQPLEQQPKLIENDPSHVRGSAYYLKQGGA